MSTPSSQVCAAWAATKLLDTSWVLLHDRCVEVVSAQLPTWSESQVHEYVEQNLHHVAEILRNEASEWQLDGKLPKYEIDNESSPYIRACAGINTPLLSKIRAIDPFIFERLCALILGRLGADAKNTQRTNDGGIDFFGVDLKIVDGVLGVPSACKAAVIGQAKRYKEGNLIKETQLREFVGSATLRRHELQVDRKFGPLTPVLFAFWTTSDFDPNAKRYARSSGIWYMDGDTLVHYVETLGLTSDVANLLKETEKVSPFQSSEKGVMGNS